jgi:hypothetical protein
MNEYMHGVFGDNEHAAVSSIDVEDCNLSLVGASAAVSPSHIGKGQSQFQSLLSLWVVARE